MMFSHSVGYSIKFIFAVISQVVPGNRTLSHKHATRVTNGTYAPFGNLNIYLVFLPGLIKNNRLRNLLCGQSIFFRYFYRSWYRPILLLPATETTGSETKWPKRTVSCKFGSTHKRNNSKLKWTKTHSPPTFVAGQFRVHPQWPRTFCAAVRNIRLCTVGFALFGGSAI